ncbi:MAG: precorrin-6A reductase [Clostridia bacterium]|jgi:precorrin-6A/cobalt-precorrin-6A reductase|nr:precorrin-6A reductase [Clostridia bacterium]
MILVLGGTTEGHKLAKAIQDKGWKVLLTTVSSYGGFLAHEKGVTEVRSKALTRLDFEQLIDQRQIKAVVDATHPYATQISEMVIESCNELNLPYGRYERPGYDLPDHPLLIRVKSYEEAVTALKPLGANIFLTIGSRRLALFCAAPGMQKKKIVARVLPEADVIKQCQELGLKPNQLVAMQGPFSREANLWMFKHFQTQVVVTKESGQVGGFLSKWEACLELGIPLIVIERPRLTYPKLLIEQEDVLNFIKEVENNE